MPSPVGGLGLAPRKKNQFCAKKLCNSEQVLVLLSYITAESGGGIIPSPESGGTYPPAPLLRRLWAVCTDFRKLHYGHVMHEASRGGYHPIKP